MGRELAKEWPVDSNGIALGCQVKLAAKGEAMRRVTAFLKTAATILLRMAKRLARPGAGPKFVVS